MPLVYMPLIILMLPARYSYHPVGGAKLKFSCTLKMAKTGP